MCSIRDVLHEICIGGLLLGTLFGKAFTLSRATSGSYYTNTIHLDVFWPGRKDYSVGRRTKSVILQILLETGFVIGGFFVRSQRRCNNRTNFIKYGAILPEQIES